MKFTLLKKGFVGYTFTFYREEEMSIELQSIRKFQKSSFNSAIAPKTQFLSSQFMLDFFPFLEGKDVAAYAAVCRTWHKASSDNKLWYVQLKLRVRALKPDHQLSAYVPHIPYKKAWMVFHVKKFPFRYCTSDLLKGMYSEIYQDRKMSRPAKAVAFFFHATIVTPVTFAMSPLTLLADMGTWEDHNKTESGGFCSCSSCHHQETDLKKVIGPIFQELAKVLPQRPEPPPIVVENTHAPT